MGVAASEGRARVFRRAVGFVGRQVASCEAHAEPHAHVRMGEDLVCGRALTWCGACGAPRRQEAEPCAGCAHLASSPGEVVRVGSAPA